MYLHKQTYIHANPLPLIRPYEVNACQIRTNSANCVSTQQRTMTNSHALHTWQIHETAQMTDRFRLRKAHGISEKAIEEPKDPGLEVNWTCQMLPVHSSPKTKKKKEATSVSRPKSPRRLTEALRGVRYLSIGPSVREREKEGDGTKRARRGAAEGL